MRAPFQILAIPYRRGNGCPVYCVFHRADSHQWQFISGGGEGSETPVDAAKRETLEESGVQSNQWIALQSLAYLPVTVISPAERRHWDKEMCIRDSPSTRLPCSVTSAGMVVRMPVDRL